MKTGSLAILLLLISLTMVSPAQAGTGLVLASAHPGGTYFPLGENLASLVNCDTRDFFVTTRNTGGATENCRLIAEGKADAGFALETIFRQALAGEGPFVASGPLNLVALARLYPSPEHLVTVRNSGIRTLSDLEGKRISIGMPGSGNRLLALEILRESGLDPGECLQCVGLPPRQAVQALAEGTIDAAFLNLALPGAAVLELSGFRDAALIPLSPAVVDSLAARHPWIHPAMIPAGTYPGQTRDILTFSVEEYLVGRADMPLEEAFLLVQTLIDHRMELALVNSSLLSLSPKRAFPEGFPIARGAARYFREKGIIPE